MKQYNVPISDACPDGQAIIYTVEEAEKKNIAFISHIAWRSAQEGDRVETSDGFITIVIKRNDVSDPNYIRTPTGTYATTRGGTVFDSEEFYERCSFSRKSRWNGKSEKNTRQQQLFFDELKRNGYNFDKAFRLVYPVMVKTRLRFLSRKKEFINSKKYLDFMNKELNEIAGKHGISKDYLVKKLKEFLESGNVGDRASLLKMGDIMLGGELFSETPTKPSRRNPLMEIEDVEIVKPEQLPERVES